MVSLTVTDSPFYQLRPRVEGNKQRASGDRIYRKILTPSKSASLIGQAGHHCDHVDEDSTLTKVQTRFAYSIHRFAMAFSWGCETSRGRTQYNGARAHCGVGKCEAAHAALSPTLYDDMLDRVSEQFKTKKFTELGEISKIYMEQRFALKEADITALSDQNSVNRSRTFKVIIKRLTPQERKGSFVGTSVEFQRNATYNNPKSSNRLDCYLERVLRTVEDNLAKKCQNKEVTPEEALLELQKEYNQLLDIAFHDLNKDNTRVLELHECWLALTKSQTAFQDIGDTTKFKAYIQNVEAYIKAYDARKNEPLKGAPKLQAMMDYFRHKQSYHVLKGLLRENKISIDQAKIYFSQNKHHLQISSEDEVKFEEGELEIRKRLDEVKIQKNAIDVPPLDLHYMFKSMFGTKQGPILKTPSHNEVAQRLVSTLPLLTPSRSDINQKTMGLVIAMPNLTGDDSTSSTVGFLSKKSLLFLENV